MKRNIISSKVEPQNTEDLWLNLVDGNIYSYEYGTWTNVNNVPNRVFNLDIDYTEENLTKFLSPLYEEGFSDDDFPKKVWDKFCETNPEFKLQGERENIRINVGINGDHGEVRIKKGKANSYGEYTWNYNGLATLSEFTIDFLNNDFFDFTINLYDKFTQKKLFSIESENYEHAHGNQICYIKDLTTDTQYILDRYNNPDLSLFKNLGISDIAYYVEIAIFQDGLTDSSLEYQTIQGVKFYGPSRKGITLASADIKLKQLSNESSFNYAEEYITYNSNHGAEYISGIVSNKLDKNKMWEYLGTDIKCLVPAKIDIVLPYNISSEEFPFLPESVGASLGNNTGDIFMASVASRYVEPENITDEELRNSFRHYLNLESPFSFGVYQKDGYDNTPIQDLTSFTDHPVKLNFEYENIAFTPEMIKEDFYQRHYDNNTETYYNVKLLYNNNNTNDRYYFSLDIYDLNIRIIRYEVRDLTTYNSILFSGSNDEEVLEYLKNNYGYNENVIYNKVSISHSYKDGACGLRTILYPIPGNLKSEETTHVKLATYADNYSKHIRFRIGLSELPRENAKEGYTIGTNTTNTVGENLRLDLYKIDIVNNNPISNTTIPLGDSIFYNGTLYIPLTIFKKALNGIDIDFSKYYYTFPAEFADSTALHVTITSKDLKVNKLIEEDFTYIHELSQNSDLVSYTAWMDFWTHTHHIKTQAYCNLLKKFGYKIIK